MTHIITTIILTYSIILPYLFGRYIVLKYKPSNFIYVFMYWFAGIIFLVILATLYFSYLHIYNYIK
jgi:hypothetical protein